MMGDVTTNLVGLYREGLFEEFLHQTPEASREPLERQVERFRKFYIPSDTRFFKDMRTLSTFKNVVLPHYPPSKTIRIACVGCSDGREPYSFLLANWNQRQILQIDAFDINSHSLETAVKGEYGVSTHPVYGELTYLNALELANPGEAYTISNGNHVGLRKVNLTEDARKNVNFQIHDIVQEPLPRNDYDVVLLLCMLMHFSPEGRERVLSNVHSSIKNDGWLLCEEANWRDPLKGRFEYFKWMENLERFGFIKQRIILPNYFQQDQTHYTQIYRR